MSLETEFSEIMQELTKFQSAIGRVYQGLNSEKERNILGDMMAKMDQARVDSEKAVPAAIAKIKEVAQDVQVRAEEQSKKIAELHKQIEERKKNPPKPPAPPAIPEVKFDPNLGAVLSAELLEHVKPREVDRAEPQRQVIKEIWEDWNWDKHEQN